MIIRIVKMEFKPENVDSFLGLFNENKRQIRNFTGCSHLELLRDVKSSNIFFTYSYWENEGFLNEYRKSDLFEAVWTKTKVLFNAKPEAWSVNQTYKLN